VVLKKDDGGFYEVEKVSLNKPYDNSLYLKAKVEYISKEYSKSSNHTSNRDFGNIEFVRVDYGLDKYFVPENTGLDLEAASRRGDLAARVKVFRGYPLLRSIFEIDK